MTVDGADAAVSPVPRDHLEQTIDRPAAGGFVITPRDGRPTRALPEDGGLRIDGPAPAGGCRLVQGDGTGTRFVLLAADGRAEIGRTTTLQGTSGMESERNLVMGDGRAYRLLLRGPADARFELLGWEATGAYLTARPGPQGWTVSPQPAASGLREIGPLLVLLAAEILESEEEALGAGSGPCSGPLSAGPASGSETET